MSKERPSPTVHCPTCGKRGAWFDRPQGPFCSQRCKLIDLGKWLGEAHTISEPLRPDHFLNEDGLAPDEFPDHPPTRGIQ